MSGNARQPKAVAGRATVTLLAAGAASALVSGCAAHAATPPPSPATTQVRSDYLAYWSALLHTSTSENPNDTGLKAHAASTMLATLQYNLALSRRQFLVAKGQVGHDITGISIDAGIATLTDCVNVDPWLLYDARTGKLKAGQLKARPHQLGVYTLARRDGTCVVTNDQVAGTC